MFKINPVPGVTHQLYISRTRKILSQESWGLY